MTELEQEIAHLQELRAKHRKNIRRLKETLANYGVDRPLKLVNELEFEQEQLCHVEEQLEELVGPSAGPPSSIGTAPELEVLEDSIPKRRVQIYLQGDFSSLSADRQSAAIAAFAAVMGTPTFRQCLWSYPSCRRVRQPLFVALVNPLFAPKQVRYHCAEEKKR